MVRGKLIFISGGVRSGKSAYAEKLLTISKATSRLVYIASGQAIDDEMKIRIRQHQKDRADHSWHTIEQATNFPQVLSAVQTGDGLLWDCMTTWLANELYEGWESGNPCIQRENCMARKEKQLFETIEALRTRVTTLVVVSNEIFHDLPPTSDETESYRMWLGHLHQKMVEQADIAIEMEGGIPIYWKGEMSQ